MNAVSIIGPSTGWLCAKISSSLSVHNEILALSGANAAEMVGSEGIRLAEMKAGQLRPLKYLSLHLPGFSQYPNLVEAERGKIREDLKTINQLHAFSGTSLHPDTAPEGTIEWIQQLGIPIGIENMDRQKAVGKTVAEIQELCRKHNLPMVIDVQHAYENGKDCGDVLALATDLAVCAMRLHGISHLHVSGEVMQAGTQTSNHASLVHATNRNEVIAALKSIRDVCGGTLPPIILEGDPLPDRPEVMGNLPEEQIEELTLLAGTTIRREIELIRNELG